MPLNLNLCIRLYIITLTYFSEKTIITSKNNLTKIRILQRKLKGKCSQYWEKKLYFC